jgi:hypothetical protein
MFVFLLSQPGMTSGAQLAAAFCKSELVFIRLHSDVAGITNLSVNVNIVYVRVLNHIVMAGAACARLIG